METKNRIETILKYLGQNPREFAMNIGVRTPQAIYDLIAGRTKSISRSMLDKISSYLPDLNREWLLYGEGEMLISNTTQQVAKGDHNIQQSANGNNITQQTGLDGVVNKFLGLLEKKEEQLSKSQDQLTKSQEQIDRLIGMLETKN